MRIAALYDIHGNLPALEAVLDEVARERVDQMVFGGDVVFGPLPRETFDRVQAIDLPTSFISGNCERAMLDILDGYPPAGVPASFQVLMKWAGQQLTGQQIESIRAWPATMRVEAGGAGGTLFCHATPRNDTEIFLKTTDEARLAPIFTATGASLVLCGHTHMPFDRRIAGVRVVNAGSVGMSFAGPGAYWALIDGAEVELRRTRYDTDAAAARVRASSYPQAEEFARSSVLDPPDEVSTLARYRQSELRQ